jgi:hypothetical protein
VPRLGIGTNALRSAGRGIRNSSAEIKAVVMLLPALGVRVSVTLFLLSLKLVLLRLIALVVGSY